MSFKERLTGLERRVIAEVLQAGTVLGAADQLEEGQIATILKQRRYLAFAFTPMCEYLLCALDDADAIAIVSGIILEEFGLSPSSATPLRILSHREKFLCELRHLHVGKAEALHAAPSKKTRHALAALATLVFHVGKQSELEQLVFLRFSGEVLTGSEFSTLYYRLETLKVLSQKSSDFLFPHVDYDVLALEGGTSHAERYLPLLESRIGSEADWARTENVMRKAAEIRRRFYLQFNGVTGPA